MLKKALTVINKHLYLAILSVLFYALAVIGNVFEFQHEGSHHVLNHIVNNIHKEEKKFENLCIDSAFLTQQLKQPTANKYTNWQYFLFDNNATNKEASLAPIAWNTNSLPYNLLDSLSVNQSKFIQSKTTQEVILIKKRVVSINHTPYTVLGILELKNLLHLKHNNISFYIKKITEKIKPNSTVFLLKDNKANYLEINIDGQMHNHKYAWWVVVLAACSFILFLEYINVVSKIISKKVSFNIGLLILVISLLVVRFLLYFSPFPYNTFKLTLFDPTLYASSVINPSLGDVGLNTIFLSWVVGFLRHNKYTFRLKLEKKYPLVIILISLAFFTVCTFLITDTIQSLVVDSNISFDVLNFFSLSIYSVVAIGALSMLVILFLRISNLIFVNKTVSSFSTYKQLIIILCTGVLILIFNSNEENFKYYNWLILLWILLYTTILNTAWFKRIMAEKSFTIVLFGVVFVGLSCSILLVTQNRNLEKAQRLKIAERILLQVNENCYNNTQAIDLYNKKTSSFNEDIQGQTNNYSTENIKYQYALYINNNLVDKYGEYSFKHRVTPLKGYNFESTNSFGFSTLNYASGNKQITIIYNNQFVLEFLTLFNYFFVAFIITAFFFITLPKWYKSSYYYKKITINIGGIRTQMVSIIVIITIITYVLIVVVTVAYFIKKSKESIKTDLVLQADFTHQNLKKINTFSITDSSKITQTIINFLRTDFEYRKTKFNYYNVAGNLVESNVYDSSIHQQPYKINSVAYYNLQSLQQQFFIGEEDYNQKKYFNIYFPVYIQNNQHWGYLSIPNFNTASQLNKEISGLISTLINFSALLLILAIIAVYYFTNRLTYSFTMIGQKMKALDLDAANEAILWEKDDEIGVLIKAYNSMVKKLADSAKALAKSEREGAWKEMARQVAHEIKNPLTPMKLSIQYLQKAISENKPNATQLAQQVTETLIEQINQLNSIASDFSQFANISANTKNEHFDVRETLKHLQQLHTNAEQASFEYYLPNKQCMVYADKIQISRLFTNLIKNAIEACHEVEDAKIKISLDEYAYSYIISIADNGTGIKEENKANIFKPNFTTKTSGTGLGLAICKSIVENVGGSIYYNSSVQGTVFYVELPKE